MAGFNIRLVAALLWVTSGGCATRQQTVSTEVGPAEPPHFTLLKQVHRSPNYTRALLDANIVAQDVEWWVAGDSVRFPWAGTRRGVSGIDDFSRTLGQHMRYAGFEVREYVVGENQIAAVIFARGTARATGKPFASEVVRLYDFRNEKIVRVRSFYDTDAYYRAMQPEP